MEFRPYQKEAINRMIELYDKGKNTCLISPTASGKTVMIRGFVEHLLKRDSSLKICIVTHVLEVLDNLRQTLEGLDCDFKSIQYLNRHPECKYDLIFIDEAHMSGSHSYRKIISESAKITFGATGTPVRGLLNEYPDEITVYPDSWKLDLHGIKSENLFQEFVTTIDTRDLIAQGYIADYEIISDYDFHIKHTGSKMVDYTKNEIDSAITPEECVAYINATLGDKKAIVFMHSIEFANEVGKSFPKTGAVITSKTTKQERIELFRKFKNNEIKILIGVSIFTTGVDVPDCDCAYIFRPTRSLSLYFQMIGRTLRLAKGKTTAIIYDYVRNIKRIGTTPKQVTLSEMILDSTFSKEECELCGAFGVIESKTNKKCRSVPTEYVSRVSKFLSDNEDLYNVEFVGGNDKKVVFDIPDMSLLSNSDLLDYYELLYEKVFPSYVMPVILNSYGRWELANARNIGNAVQKKQSRCYQMVGKCKYSNTPHPYFLISDNLRRVEKKRNAKIKK